MKFYTTEQLGPKQSLTKEGFLLCEDVTIARTGTQIYGPSELPHLQAGPDGIIRAERSEADVFRPETIASFQGKPIVDEHPDEDVVPENWRLLSVGVVMNPRRGVAAADDTIIADFLVQDASAIASIRAGKREVSCGYDADYEELGPGIYRQYNILGNHVALVEHGRCGSRCAIGDSNITEEVEGMPTLVERIKCAFRSKDESALNTALAEIGDDPDKDKDKPETHVHVHVRDAEKEDEKEKEDKKDEKTTDSIKDAVFADARFTSMANDVKAIKDAVMDKEKEDEEEEEKTEDEGNRKIEGDLEEEAPPGTGDRAYKAKDSAYLADSFQETVALAEIIAPGFSLPTFDAKAAPKKTYDAMCRFRRSVLDVASSDAEIRSYLDELVNGRELKDLSCSRVRDVFFAVGAFKKRRNNDVLTAPALVSAGGTGIRSRIQTNADMNKRNAEYWNRRS